MVPFNEQVQIRTPDRRESSTSEFVPTENWDNWSLWCPKQDKNDSLDRTEITYFK